MGAHIVILEAMLCCPHKRDAQKYVLDTLSNHEAELEQQEQCNWTFGSTQIGVDVKLISGASEVFSSCGAWIQLSSSASTAVANI